MWTIDNQTPFAAERAWVRDKNGAEVWVVAIKGAFDVTAHGQVTLAAEQVPVTLAPEYVDEDHTELRYDTDLPECKQATDVIVNGTAYAPEGHPAQEWTVNLCVGPIDKTLFVRGDRRWQKRLLRLTLGEPEPIASLPLSYRYAYGGQAPATTGASLLDTHNTSLFYKPNPIGRGYSDNTQDNKALIEQYAPNIEYLDSQVKHWKDQILPAGLGAIPAHWQGRTQWAGTYDQVWEEQRQPLLPEDFSPLFFQSVPNDQQVPGFLKGGERVKLNHLTPMKHWSFYLPKASFYLRTTFTDGHKTTHRAQLHTVIIEPDHHRLIMVWHSHLPCHHRVNQLDKTLIRLKKRILQPRSDAPSPVWTGETEGEV